MMKQKRDGPSPGEIQKKVAELCSEDDWGSWELWWNIASSAGIKDLFATKQRFIRAIEKMTSAKALVAKRMTKGKLTPTLLDSRELAREIDAADSPDPDHFYWFGTE
jgi:hypothetical protein